MIRIFVTLILLIAICIPALGDIINVPADTSSIQGAISLAGEGDTVLVAEGTYLENINFQGKAITVSSLFFMDGDTNHIHNTIIDGGSPADPDSGSVVYFISGEDTTSVLTGFTITGGNGTVSNPIYWEAARGGGGIFCHNSNASIRHNIIKNNSVNDSYEIWGGGIYSRADTLISTLLIVEENTIKQNTIDADSGAFGGGIYVNCNARIVNNLLTENTVNSDFVSFGGGLAARDHFYSGHELNMNNNTITYNQALTSFPEQGGVGGGFEASLPYVYIKNNNISYNKSGGPRDCWASAFDLYLAQKGSVVEDNIISNNSSAQGRLSGTIFLTETNGVKFRRNIIENNSTYWGGGIRSQESNGNVISENQFIGNSATEHAGGLYIHGSGSLVQNNLFVGNEANLGGGIRIADLSLASNLAFAKSGVDAGARKKNIFGRVLKKSINASQTKGLLNRVVIVNNTIVNNSAGSDGGGILVNGMNPLVMNTILWGNDAPSGKQIRVLGGSSASVVYSNIEGGWSGTGNIDSDPQFIAEDDFHLSDSSLAIGAGKDSVQSGINWFLSPISDLDGNPRPFPDDSMPDMGAFESPRGEPIVDSIEDEDFNLPVKFALDPNFPNPFNPETMINYQLAKNSKVQLSIYNILGQKVATLVDKEQIAGKYSVTWDATGFASGVYLYKLQTDKGFVRTMKLILLK